MIFDYELSAKSKPSEREVWLMSKHAEKDGHVVTKSMMRAMDSGDLKYHDGKFYKLCKHCVDYLPLDSFYTNKRYVMDYGYICKTCTATRRRIKMYATASYLSDVGMREANDSLKISLGEENKRLMEERLIDNEPALEEDS